ncbi:hypothetical protein AVEN_76314-1 [Araneus ventricosus]|uniref:Uncharacterized protein n=1 Tax=Araneus ventricosus TaxID=182803 RepID=A0A4Y2MPK0_ARAVE|nr:hypothetical protein AVEN_76314-1 [Araneus ventricosus]
MSVRFTVSTDGKVSASGPKRSRFKTRFHQKSVVNVIWCTLNLTSKAKGTPDGVVRKFGEEDADSGVIRPAVQNV